MQGHDPHKQGNASMDEKADRWLSAKEYERFAAASDRLTTDMDTALLGLVGEVGSLVSALKKKRRDTDGFLGYHEAVLEELGDVLWYVSAVARRGGTSLSDAIARAAGATQGQIDVGLGQLAPSPGGSNDARAFERALLELAGEAGDLAKRFIGAAYRDNVDALRGDLVKFLRPLGRAAAAAEVSLDALAGRILRRPKIVGPASESSRRCSMRGFMWTSNFRGCFASTSMNAKSTARSLFSRNPEGFCSATGLRTIICLKTTIAFMMSSILRTRPSLDGRRRRVRSSKSSARARAKSMKMKMERAQTSSKKG
jgi:NTP pyrophosphatase (non-canonical NTP hydrolase)